QPGRTARAGGDRGTGRGRLPRGHADADGGVRSVIRRGRLRHAAGRVASRGGGAVLIGVTLAGAPVLAPGSLARLAGTGLAGTGPAAAAVTAEPAAAPAG